MKCRCTAKLVGRTGVEMEALTGAFLLHKVPRYDIKADRKLETQEKYYICDLAMRGAVMGDDGIAEEAALESALLMELLVRGFSVYVGKQGQSQIALTPRDCR